MKEKLRCSAAPSLDKAMPQQVRLDATATRAGAGSSSVLHSNPHNKQITTHLGGDGILCSGVCLRGLSLLSLLCVVPVGLVDATEASVDKAGSWIDELLPCRCSVYDATV